MVQVLFFEQLQLRHAIAENLIAVEAAQTDAGRPSVLRREQEEVGDEGDEEEEEDDADVDNEAPGVSAVQEGGVSNTWRAAVRENQVLRLDMDSMRTRVHQLERECSTMRKVIEKIDNTGGPPSERGGGSNSSVKGWRGSLTKRFGCKFKTQVCDSHEPSVVDVRKGRRHHQQQ